MENRKERSREEKEKQEKQTRENIYHKFETEYEKSSSRPNSQSLKSWRNQAQQLGRSQSYLNRIDKVADYASKNPQKFAQSNTKSLEKAMKQDRAEFKKLVEQKQQPDRQQTNTIFAKRRR